MEPVFFEPDDFENGAWEGPMLQTRKQRIIAMIVVAMIVGLVFF